MTDGILTYADRISWGIIENEVFIFDELTGEIFLLKGNEKELWLLIRNGESLSNLVGFMKKNQNVNEDKVLKIIGKLQRWNLIARKLM